ncbi:hypothetical protein FJTKL_08959 [Diaporthe vaccinii]|uniref:Uncharacterized protein n=1 Tax=Diaporthe vaccinii TaxID=105482 RepID=A0ABR4DRB9_9PEZI
MAGVSTWHQPQRAKFQPRRRPSFQNCTFFLQSFSLLLPNRDHTPGSMTSRLLKEARQSIINNGFWALKDTDIGKRMDEIVTDRYRVKTEKGLDLCRVAVLEREITREVIKFFFPKAVLGYYKIYGQTQDHHCTLNGTTPDMRILEVQLWSSHSQCVFDTGSHQHDLKATAAPNGLLKIPPERLEELGITPTEVEMPDGGLYGFLSTMTAHSNHQAVF